MDTYEEDLAYVHDVGFGDFARDSAPGLLDLLRKNGVARGRVCDLGCGSGIWARALTDAGYEAEGIDFSAAMIALARKKAPRAGFRRGSFLDVELAACDALTSIGEVFNYVFDPQNKPNVLPKIFRRIHRALRPGGVLLFDVAGPARMDGRNHAFRQGQDWAILTEQEYDRKRLELTRHMTVFRKRGNSYRRSQETHKQKLYAPAQVAEELRAAGFRTRHLRGYGKMKFPRGLGGFLGIAGA